MKYEELIVWQKNMLPVKNIYHEDKKFPVDKNVAKRLRPSILALFTFFFSIIHQILRDMGTKKWRSALALFGIVWGTMTVILLLALGSGFQTAFQKNQMALAEGTIFVVPGTTSKSYQGFPKGRPIHMKANTAIEIKNTVPDIQSSAPILIHPANFTANKKTFTETLFGVGAEAFPLQKVDVTPGSRFINPIDIAQKNRVALVGYKIHEKLFDDQTIIGKTLLINNIPFQIIGEIPNPGKEAHVWYDDNVVIPYTSYINLYGDEDLKFFIFKPKIEAAPDIVKNNMQHYFANKYHYDTTDNNAILIQDTTSFFRFFKWFLIGIEIFLGICGSLTLAVGALGVTNIMFLIVQERTKEIGIRMATGARDYHILTQILLESLVIVGLGGLIGFLMSAFIIALLNHIGMPSWLGSPKISPMIVISTISVLAIMGFLAGFFPAKRASKMDPVEALGY